MRFHRWMYAMIGVIVMTFAGLVYAWSILSAPIALEFVSWSKTQLSFTFTLCMMLFCLGGLIGGMLSRKIDVRINVWLSAALFLVGFYLASRAQTLLMLYIGYGLLAGFALGLAYNAVMITMTKWFPDRQGYISGILLMGFGIGGFLIGKIYQACTPTQIGGWRISFLIVGIVLFVVLAVGGFFFLSPSSDFQPPPRKKAKDSLHKAEFTGIDVPPSAMLKRPSFWLFFLWDIFIGGAGLALISQAGSMIHEINASINSSTFATAVGLISILNGLGRVVVGEVFDRFGYKKTMFLVDFLLFLSSLVLIGALLTKNFPLLLLGFAGTGFSFGGITPTTAAFARIFYGPTNYPINYPLFVSNLLFSSLSSTLAGALFDASQSYLSTFFFMLAASVLGMICTHFIRKP